MPLPTINIPNFSGVSTPVPVANSGRQLAADSSAVASSNEDFAAIGALTETAPVSDTASSGLNGRLQRLAQRFTSLIALFPASLGTKTAANSLAVTLASDGALTTAIGAQADLSASTDTGTFSLIALFKRALGYLSTIATNAASTADSPVEVHQPADVISFTPTLDTAIYASGDVLFATAAITGVTRANDLRAKLDTLTVIDKSKQNPAFTLLFYQTNVTSAAANAANNLSDADQITCLGYVNVLAADYLTFANNSVLCYSGPKSPGLLVESATGSTTVYVVGILQAGTPTFAVGDLMLKLGFLQS